MRVVYTTPNEERKVAEVRKSSGREWLLQTSGTLKQTKETDTIWMSVLSIKNVFLEIFQNCPK